MECRNRNFFPESDSASFMLSITEVDVRRLLVKTYSNLFVFGVTSCEYWTREDLLFLFQSLSQDLKDNVGGKWAKDLALWAFNLAVRKGLVVQVPTDKNLFQFSETIIENAIKRNTTRTHAS